MRRLIGALVVLLCAGWPARVDVASALAIQYDGWRKPLDGLQIQMLRKPIDDPHGRVQRHMQVDPLVPGIFDLYGISVTNIGDKPIGQRRLTLEWSVDVQEMNGVHSCWKQAPSTNEGVKTEFRCAPDVPELLVGETWSVPWLNVTPVPTEPFVVTLTIRHDGVSTATFKVQP